MEGIDAEVLISLVESKPVLWDKTLDIYKVRIATRKAWEEVCLALKPDFETIGDADKNAFGKEVIRRWTNLRDCYAKSKRDEKVANKSGSEAKKRKKYVFSDQLRFLNKIYTDNNTVDSLEPAIEQVNDLDVDEEAGGSGAGDSDVSINTNLNLPTKKTSSQLGKRKHKKPDEIELKMLKALEPKPPCSKMSFLQSLMPHLDTFTAREFLHFQMGVLNVIENINKMKETI